MIAATALAVTALTIPGPSASGAPATRRSTHAADAVTAITPDAPIKHVVIIYQENHTFDNVLGKLCVIDQRCNGATAATLSTGATYDLTQAADFIPNVSHGTNTQGKAINNGLMNEFDKVPGCTAATGYACLTQYDPSQIPNLAAIARQYAISDATFEMDHVLSFGAHLELVTTDLDGFGGEIPKKVSYAPKTPSKNWGCNSTKVTGWRPDPSAKEQLVPSCIPLPGGVGTFWDTWGPNGIPQVSPVATVPTVLDELNEAGKTWRTYLTQEGFDICSYVAKCHDSSQQQDNVDKTTQILKDAAAGTLPDVSIVLPSGTGGNTSQHNHTSMAIGDNWIGTLMSSLQASPEWDSTAVFITYDDCGCFYDHVVPPNPEWGLRLPMVIASPWVKPGSTDSTPTSFVGMMTFIEHLFGLAPLTAADADSYDYADSFDFTQTPDLVRMKPVTTKVGAAELRQIAKSPWIEDDDPT
jgi:phospholipase C